MKRLVCLILYLLFFLGACNRAPNVSLSDEMKKAQQAYEKNYGFNPAAPAIAVTSTPAPTRQPWPVPVPPRPERMQAQQPTPVPGPPPPAPRVEITEHGIYLDGVFYTISEFETLLENAEEIKNRQDPRWSLVFETVSADGGVISVPVAFALSIGIFLLMDLINQQIMVGNTTIPYDSWPAIRIMEMQASRTAAQEAIKEVMKSTDGWVRTNRTEVPSTSIRNGVRKH